MIAHIETANEECTDALLLCAIESGLLQTWAEVFPTPAVSPRLAWCVTWVFPRWL